MKREFSVQIFEKCSFSNTYLLTHSMVRSPSWEANWFAASQEIPRILWNPKVHYRIHKGPPPVPILDQPSLGHIPTSHLLEIHPNIIHPSTPKFPQWSLSLRFLHQDPIRPPLLTHTRHMPSPSHRFKTYRDTSSVATWITTKYHPAEWRHKSRSWYWVTDGQADRHSLTHRAIPSFVKNA